MLGASVAVLSGCAVPPAMEVRSNRDPAYVDDYVRFRTTYYFRVFDACEGVNEDTYPADRKRTDTIFDGKRGGPYRLRTDSLYRFHMTGKGSSLANRIHFESGSLRKEQIDPFGATVAFDKANNRFFFKSQEETERDAKRAARFEDLAALRALRKEMLGPKGEETGASRAIDEVILAQIALLKPIEVGQPAAAMPSVASEAGAYAEAVKLVAGNVGVAKNLKAEVGDVARQVAATKEELPKARTRLSTDAQLTLDALQQVPQKVRTDLQLLSTTLKPAEHAVLAPASAAIEEVKQRVEALIALVAADKVTLLKGHASTLAAGTLPADVEPAAGALATAVEDVVKAGTASVEAMAKAQERLASTAPIEAVPRQQAIAATKLAASLAPIVEAALGTAKVARNQATRLGAAARYEKLLDQATGKLTTLSTKIDDANAATELGHLLNKAATSAEKARSTAKKAEAAAIAVAGPIAKAQGKAADDAEATANTKAAKDAGKLFSDAAVDYALEAGKAADDLSKAATETRPLAALAQEIAALGEKGEALREEAGLDGRFAFSTTAGSLAVGAAARQRELQQLAARAERLRLAAQRIGDLASGAEGGGAGKGSASSQVLECPRGTVSRRGFQVMGPEGWRTFDQDERLIMAMSSSAKPLIGMLQDLSGRVLNAKPNPSQVLLPLVQEQLRTREALDAARNQKDAAAADVTAALDAIIAAFNRGTGK